MAEFTQVVFHNFEVAKENTICLFLKNEGRRLKKKVQNFKEEIISPEKVMRLLTESWQGPENKLKIKVI